MDLAAFFEEAEREARANAEGVLVINAAPRKSQLNFLPGRTLTRNVREKYRPSENFGGASFVFASDAQRKGRPGLLFVAQLEFGKHRLFGENMFGHIELQIDSGEDDAREHSGNENSGERASQEHEQQIISGVYGGEDQNKNSDEVNNSFAR